jgi:hypothetical protein
MAFGLPIAPRPMKAILSFILSSIDSQIQNPFGFSRLKNTTTLKNPDLSVAPFKVPPLGPRTAGGQVSTSTA